MSAADRSADDRAAPAAPEGLDPIDAVVQLSFAIQTVLSEIAAAQDLSMTQLRVLGILRDREPAMLDLASYLKLSKSSVSGLIDRAERRGLVERTTSPDDRRAVHVRLTADGRLLAERMTAEVEEALAHVLDALSPRDRARLSTLAAAVVRRQAAGRL
jgi:DNA-binding MarR family transcriptional regulator